MHIPSLIDNSKFTVIYDVVLMRTRHLCKYYRYVLRCGTKVEVSCFYLMRLVSERSEDLPDRIVALFADLRKHHFSNQNDVQTIGKKQVHISQFIWGRMCVLAYFFFHDEPAWQNVLFRKMDERIIVPELAEDVLTAKGLIDEYYKERALLTGEAMAMPKMPSAIEIATEAANSKPQPKPEEIFNFTFQRTGDYQHMLEVLEAEKKDCSDIEWARHALTIYRHKNAFVKRPSTFTQWLPIFCEMFGREIQYREPNKLDKGQNQVSLEPFLPR